MKNSTQCSSIRVKEINFKEIMYFTLRKWGNIFFFSSVKLKLTGAIVQLPVIQNSNQKNHNFLQVLYNIETLKINSRFNHSSKGGVLFYTQYIFHKLYSKIKDTKFLLINLEPCKDVFYSIWQKPW